MKTRFLLVLIVASLGLNATLLVLRRPARADDSAAFTTGDNAGSSRPATNPKIRLAETPALTPFVWKNPGLAPDELRAFAAELRAAGVPDNAIVRMVTALVRDRHHAPVAALPHWQLLSPNVETRRLMNAAALNTAREVESILGPIASPAALLDPIVRRHTYGELPDAKVNALLRVEQDYHDVSLEFTTSSNLVTTSEEITARQKQLSAREKERLADIAGVLTPEEFTAWERRSSVNAQRVQHALRNTSVNAEEYATLFAIQKAFEPDAAGNSLTIGARERPAAEIYAMHDQVRSLLGPERFDTYLKASDYQYAVAANFAAKQGNLTADQTYAFYQLQREAMSAIRAQTGAASVPQETRRQQFAEFNARLEIILGPAGAETFRQQDYGSIFNSYRAIPRPPNTPSPAPARSSPPKN